MEVSEQVARENVIAVEVTAGPDNQTHFSQGHAGFIAELLDDAGHLLLATGSGWRGIAFTGFQAGQRKGFTRACDLRAYPHGWQLPDFDDSTWPPLVADLTPRPALRSHALPPLTEQFVAPDQTSPSEAAPGSTDLQIGHVHARLAQQAALALRSLRDPPDQGDVLTIQPADHPVTTRLTFNQMLAGHLRFCAHAAEGTKLELDFEEVPGAAESDMHRLRLTLPGGTTDYESPAYFSARAVRLTVHFPPGAPALALRGLGLVTRSQPVADRGAFTCSDPFLNDLWQICRQSLRLCMQDIHLDSPRHQEALGDHGDYLVEMLMAYYAFGDYALAHVDVERMALDLEQQQGAQFHTSYALLLPDVAADLLLFTGDRATARAALPAIRLTLQRALAWRGEEGLLSQAPNYMFVDWIELGGANYHHPPAAQGMGALTAFAVRALRRAAWLTRQLDENETEAADWETAAAALADAFRICLFDPERRMYRDGLRGISRQPTHGYLPPDGATDIFTRHTNILAVWAGIVTGSEAAELMRRVLADPSLPEPQPYFQHYLFDALSAAGVFQDHARAQLDLWRPMLAAHPYSLREMWTGGDYSHAWGGTPLVQLSRRILGVEPLEPGWRAVRVHPQTLDLDWAHGTVPTPHGDITVAWRRAAHGLTVDVHAPEGINVHRSEDVRTQEGGSVTV